MDTDFIPIKEFLKNNKWATLPMVRRWYVSREDYGIADAFVKIGYKIYMNPKKIHKKKP